MAAPPDPEARATTVCATDDATAQADAMDHTRPRARPADRRGHRVARRPSAPVTGVLPWLAATAALLTHGPPPARAQFATYDRVDRVFTRDPARFAAMWEAAETSTVRIAMFGDSQEASPAGAGVVYIPRVNYEFFLRYGNVPETQFHGHGALGGPTNAEWLLRSRLAPSRGPSYSRLRPGQILPGVGTAAAHSTLNDDANINGQRFGLLTMLQPDAADVVPHADLQDKGPFFDTAHTVKARIWAATHPSSGEIAYRARPRDSSIPNYWAPITTVGSSAIGLQGPTFAIRHFDTEPLDFAGNRYMQVEVSGSDDAKLTDILGLRYFNETRPEGVVVQDFAAGGKTINDLRQGHPRAGPMLSALGPWHAVWMHYGTVDAHSANRSAAGFKSDVLAWIAMLRGPQWLDDPTLPVILSVDVFRAGATAAEQQEFDRYAGALHEIALDDPAVLLLNTRRIMDELGLNAGSFAQFLDDNVHYTAEGALRIARAEVAALLSVPEPATLLVLGPAAIALGIHRRRAPKRPPAHCSLELLAASGGSISTLPARP